MNTPDFASAEQKIQKIMLGYFYSDPIMLNILSMFNCKADPKQDTIGIDIRGKYPEIKYNPNFINSLNNEVLETIISSEGLKILLKHCTSRMKEPRQISSMASNITVGEMQDAHMSALIGEEDLSKIIPLAKNYGLPEDEIFEEYYRLLLEKQEEMIKYIEQNWDKIKEEMEKNQDGQPQSGEGDGEGEECERQGGYKEFDGQNDAVKEYYNPNGTNKDGWGENPLVSEVIKNFVNENKDNVKQWGKYSGNFIAEIVAANTPKISYKVIIRNFAKSVVDILTSTTRMKVSRRYDLLSPGIRRTYKSKILFAIDVSGSMSDADIAEGFAVVNNVFKFAEINYVTFDTEVKDIEMKFNKPKKTFKVTGRGGTDVNLVFEFADKRGDYDGVVLFSDMMFSEQIRRPKCKVLWLAHSKGQKPPVDWGKVATLERS